VSHRSRGPKRDLWYPPKTILEADSCPHCGKAIYESRGSASSAIKRIERQDKQRGIHEKALTAYECPAGNGWHIAHRVSQGHRTGVAPHRVRETIAA
jgi:ribosomal protein L32